MNIALVLAGGIGQRFKNKQPKQYTLLNGKMAIEYVLQAIRQAKSLSKIIIVAGSKNSPCKQLAEFYGADLILGGSTRNESLHKGLLHIHSQYLNCNKVMIFDAVRPLVPPNLFDLYMQKLDTFDVVVTCRHLTDEVGCYHDFNLCRDDYFLMSSPQAYHIKWLDRYFDFRSPKTEVLYQMPRTIHPCYYFGFANNFKLTYPWDKAALEAMLQKK